jgi:hypothetical protein
MPAQIWAIPQYIEKSDVAIIGFVRQEFYAYHRNPEFSGRIYSVEVERVLYAKPKVIDTVFSADDLERINAGLKRDTSEHIFVIAPHTGIGSGTPEILPSRVYLFFFKFSNLLTEFPKMLIEDLGMYIYNPPLGYRSVDTLNQETFFQLTFDIKDCARRLGAKREDDDWLPVMKAVGPVMTIPNQAKKQREFRDLAQHKNCSIANTAQYIWRKIEFERLEELRRQRRLGRGNNQQ